MTSRKTIDEFLGLKRLAVIGVSSNPRDFTRSLFRTLQKRGYELVPVNPRAGEIEGIPAVAHVADAPAVEGALLLTKPAVTDEVVRECKDAGIRHIWMHRAGGAGAVSRTALEFCANHQMAVVEGECPFMFLPNAGFPHNAHAFCRKLIGRLPK
ncbi:MAG TPA: CoA-binding protein [Verrucomicrobiae bacterium]|nr:CoA-binding protein [Verrucomicrobiae bacterium]